MECNRAMYFSALQTFFITRGGHQCIGQTECQTTSTSAILPACPSCTSNKILLHETALVISFFSKQQTCPFLFWYGLCHSLLSTAGERNEGAHHASDRLKIGVENAEQYILKKDSMLMAFGATKAYLQEG